MKRRKPYYEAFGVSKDAPPAEVRRAYRALAKRLHPDRHRDPERARRAEEQLKEINAAWTEYLALMKRGPDRATAHHRPPKPESDPDEEVFTQDAREYAARAGHGRSARTTRDRYRAERAGASRDRDERERRSREAAERVRLERLRAHFERRAREHERLLKISRFTMAGMAGLCITLVVVILILLAAS
jgi:curved DNA-binding protein CbpA